MRKSKNCAIFRVLLVLLALGISVPAIARAQSPTWRGITVLELLSSDNCQDSPPADAVFTSVLNDPAYADDPGLIAFSCHVSYYDNPYGGKGLSQSLCDERHQLYMQYGTEAATTPAMIMNGKFFMTGVRENVVRAGIKMSKAISKIARIQIDRKDDALLIGLPDLGKEPVLDVWLITYRKSAGLPESAKREACSSGSFTNVATHLEKLFSWNGTPLQAKIDISALPPADGYIVLAQPALFSQHEPDIIAAGKLTQPILPEWVYMDVPEDSQTQMMPSLSPADIMIDVNELNRLIDDLDTPKDLNQQ